MPESGSANYHEERPEAAQREWLSKGTRPGADPWKTTVFDLFRAAVVRDPGAVAISGSDPSLTYAGLWNFAASVRASLAGQGIGPGDRVGIAAGRSADTIAAILGVVMAGACYVPVEVEQFPASFIARLGDKAGLRGWITDRAARQSTPAEVWSGRSMISLDDVPRSASQAMAAIPQPAIKGESPLYIMFTSGSTGEPKGVVIPHRAVSRLVIGQDFIHFGSDEAFLLHSPLSFDASTLELWGSLLHGSRLVVAPPGQLSLDDYSNWISSERVTTLWLTAALFHLAADRAPEIFAPLRQLVFGGDVIAPRAVERVRALYPRLRMVNGYGPTENTTFTCCYVVPQEYRVEGSLPIGRPIAHTEVHVVDANGISVAPGQEGELAAGGAGVALGYLDSRHGAVEHFPPDPFAKEPGRQLYRTGDRVRLRPDGEFEFFGRFDRQVKIAGHRVDLDALEGALSECAQVAQAAAIVISSAEGEKRLVACVVLADLPTNAKQNRDPEADLRKWAAQRLPQASIPRRWIFLGSLPLGSHGKVDRAALEALCETPVRHELAESTAAKIDNEFVGEGRLPDVSETAEYIRRLWSRLLGRDSIGLEENFFDLGGTSLLLIEMHSRLSDKFSAVPPLVDLFGFPTVNALAERLCGGIDRRSASLDGRNHGERERAAMLARRRTRLATLARNKNASTSATATGDQRP